ncbi:MAG: hypothetical protein R3F62_25840 [Planctomycetota bacterium]
MHPLTPTDRWRVIAALVALGVDVHTEKFQPLEAQPGGWDQGPAERLLYAMSRGQRGRGLGRGRRGVPGLRAYAAWRLLEHEGDPARWGLVIALDPGWTFGAIVLARALQTTDLADPRLAGLVRGAVEQAEAIHGLRCTWPTPSSTRASSPGPAARCGRTPPSSPRAMAGATSSAAPWSITCARSRRRYLVAACAWSSRGRTSRSRGAWCARPRSSKRARRPTFAQARSDKDRLKRAGELDAARTAHEQLRQALAQLERR